jgi:hypothetical protein
MRIQIGAREEPLASDLRSAIFTVYYFARGANFSR